MSLAQSIAMRCCVFHVSCEFRLEHSTDARPINWSCLTNRTHGTIRPISYVAQSYDYWGHVSIFKITIVVTSPDKNHTTRGESVEMMRTELQECFPFLLLLPSSSTYCTVLY